MLIPAGCSKEELKQAIEDAKTQTQSLTESAVQAVEEKLPEAGSIALEMTPAVEKIKKVNIELISIGDGRPNVVQIASYDPDSSSRSYPAVLLHGSTGATSASSLAGESVQCDMYFQESPDGPIAMTKPGGYVTVQFGSLNVEDNAVSATLGMANLVRSDDQSVQIRGGDIVAVVQGEGG